MKEGAGAINRVVLAALAVLALMAAMAGALAASASASQGGISGIPVEPEVPAEPAPVETTTPGAASVLSGDRAIPPLSAPAKVKRVIAAANKIRTTPYVWGGGHGSWISSGYDCSGSVSYALHGGGLLGSPLVSGSFASWGAPGPGRWITIYANSQHVFAVIAGLRWDTVGDSSGTGPRWHPEMVSSKGFVVRHPVGY